MRHGGLEVKMSRSTGLRVRAVVTAAVAVVAVGSGRVAQAAPEFRVNGYTTGSQMNAAVARLSDGGFVVAWNRAGSGDPDGIFARRFGPTGVPAGAEFRVNTITTGYQWQTAVAAVPGGGFVVAWSADGQDGSDQAVLARRFDAFGAAIGGEFQVNTFTTGRQYVPRVAVGPAGQFVVAWSSFGGDGNHFGVSARRYDAGGAPQGGEFQVNTYTPYIQATPSVAFDGAGNFVIAWLSAQDGSNWGVFGRRFDAFGAPLGGEFAINTYTTGFQFGASVSTDPAGNFVVAWVSNGQDGDGSGVFFRRFDSAGAAVGPEYRANTYTTDDQRDAQVSWDPLGNFVVSWTDEAQDGSSYGVFARRFEADGTQLGPEFRLNTYTTGQQGTPSLAVASDGGFVAAWSDGYQFGAAWDVVARIVPDLIFADPFESGGLGAWSSASTDGGDLSVTLGAALAGSFGLQGVVDDTAGLYVQDDSPEDEGRYRVRFAVDPNGFDPGEAAGKRRTRVLIAFQDAPTRRLFAVVLRRLNGQYAIGARARRDDNTQASTPFFNIGDVPHFVDVAWTRAGTADSNDGRLDLWIDGAHVSTLPGLDNNASGIDFVRLGALSVKATATGTLFWDGFESRRVSGPN
jgi:hypothetical protein